MSELVRVLGLVTGLPVALVLLAIGIAQVTQTDHQNWIMFIIGGALLLLTAPPLLLGSPERSVRPREGGSREGRAPVPRRAR